MEIDFELDFEGPPQAASGGGESSGFSGTFTVNGSDGMSGTGNVHADTFDDEFGGDGGSWNQATAGDVVTEADGIATMPDAASNEVMFGTDAQWPSAPEDCGVIIQGFKGGGARALFLADRRNTGNGGPAIGLQLEEGQKPKAVVLSASLINPVVTEASATAFSAASNVGTTEKNYLIRCTEVAGEAGGYTCELWEGTWEASQGLEDILLGLSLIESVDIFTAAARALRDDSGTTTRGMIRRANGTGTSCTFDGLIWGTVS